SGSVPAVAPSTKYRISSLESVRPSRFETMMSTARIRRAVYRISGEQPAVEVRRRTEGGDAPGWRQARGPQRGSRVGVEARGPQRGSRVAAEARGRRRGSRVAVEAGGPPQRGSRVGVGGGCRARRG